MASSLVNVQIMMGLSSVLPCLPLAIALHHRYLALRLNAGAKPRRQILCLKSASEHRKALRTVMALTGERVTIWEQENDFDEITTAGDASLPENRVLVGCGGAALDILASVASFPQPDEKIRTTELQVQGGGNVGNALTAAARLGIKCRIFTKVVNDGPGSQILAELQGDGVDTSNVVIAEEGVSPFTYVIVDKKTSTRTCIHTPGFPPLVPQELTLATISALLNNAHLAYFDGRLVDTALILAEEASKRQLPILVDAERKREGLDDLLAYADYIVASSKFPQSWTEAPTLAEALLTMLLRLPRAKFVIVTLGAAGCVMLERLTPGTTEGTVQDVNPVLDGLMKEAESFQRLPPSVVSSKVGRLCLSSNSSGNKSILGRLFVGTAEAIPASELVDTTGAGDGFIGGVMYYVKLSCVSSQSVKLQMDQAFLVYSILAGLHPTKMLALGAVVAAGSCRSLGARPGLPLRTNVKVVSLL